MGLDTSTGEKNPFYGKHHTEETKAVLAAYAAVQRERGPVLPTKPERLFHEELTRQGVCFLQEQAIGRYCVDVLVPDRHLIIFVDGCYWHACPVHFPATKSPRGDFGRVPYLSKCGYRVAIIWEHEIHEDVCLAVAQALNG